MTNINSLKELISDLTPQVGLVDVYIKQSTQLEKKDTIFHVCDLDDTLFWRRDQLEWEPILQEKRWYEWNTEMINVIGLHTMIEKYYKWKQFPKDIISKFTPDNSLILTAGIPEYQHLKVQAMNIAHYPLKIVWEWKDKVMATIQHVLFKLTYIPSEIIVYEDRPEYFVKYRELIEQTLWTKLTIMKVEMDGNDGYKNIEKL